MVATENENMRKFHTRVYAIGLIVIWLRFMRSCRVFQTLGPFIAILGLFFDSSCLEYVIISINQKTRLRYSEFSIYQNSIFTFFNF